MAVFDWAESDGSDVGFKVRVLKTRFGDGYEQRAADGLNPITQSWHLKFDNVDNDIGTEIVNFLKARAGVEAFDWTPKWATSAIKVVCEDWSRSIAPGDLTNLSMTFEQRFVP